MNILHMKYAVEIARVGSINKASENLLIAQPNLSRSVKELETDLGITIFDRSSRGMHLTPDGEIFISYAKKILSQIAEVESLYKGSRVTKQHFSVSAPRASYIADAFAEFSKTLPHEPAEIYYNETNSMQAIDNILQNDYSLGIIRFATQFEKYFGRLLKEKELTGRLITEFHYVLITHKNSDLAKKKKIYFEDLSSKIEIAHADPFVPSLSLSTVKKEMLPNNIGRRIFVFERGSQFDLLRINPETFMWVSPIPPHMLEMYDLVQLECEDSIKRYKDILIYKEKYSLSDLDKCFIENLYRAKEKYIDKVN